MKTRDEAAQWLRFLTKAEFSELGKEVAFFLDEMWGLHNLKSTSLKKVDWANNTWITFVYFGSLSTVDSDHLTRLVVLAHQRMLRLSLRGIGPGYIEFMFHQRTTRTGQFSQRCPDIFDHVQEIVKHHPAVDLPQEIAA